MSAADVDEAVALCGRLTPDLAGDCLVRVYGVHERLELSDCDRVTTPLWHEECVFQFAERAAKAGQLPTAFNACASTSYGRECSFHLIREAAKPTLDGTPAAAAPALAPYLALEPTPDAPRLFWRTWFRDRLPLKHAIDPTDCPDDACRGGAREALYGSLHAIARAEGERFCTATLAEPSLWIPGPLTDAWVKEWQDGECTKRQMEATGVVRPGLAPSPGSTPPPGARPPG